MDQLVQLIESHPTRIEPKNEKHALNQIRLPRAIGSHDRSEVLVERSNFLCACIRLEVFQNQVIDNKAGFVLLYQH